MNLVSVILPTYNRAATLPRAIDSVLAQSHRELELIVVDDASTDGTQLLMEEYARRDPRVRYQRQPLRAGPAVARNTGIRRAQGEWLAFQDSDDEWLPDKLERQWSCAQAAPADVTLILGGYWIESGGKRRSVNADALLAGRDVREDLLIGDPFVTPAWLLRRSAAEAVGLFDEQLSCLEDWDLAFKLVKRGPLRAIAAPGFIKYASADSVYGDLPRRRRGLEALWARYRDLWAVYPHREAWLCAELGSLRCINGEYRNGLPLLLRALRLAPFTRAVYRNILRAFLHR